VKAKLKKIKIQNSWRSRIQNKASVRKLKEKKIMKA
jgi:hypothetical protein